jgi:hypothetical protein
VILFLFYLIASCFIWLLHSSNIGHSNKIYVSLSGNPSNFLWVPWPFIILTSPPLIFEEKSYILILCNLFLGFGLPPVPFARSFTQLWISAVR